MLLVEFWYTLDCFIHIFGLFYESKLLCIKKSSNLSVLGKIRGSSEGLEFKIEEVQLEIPSYKPWGAAPSRAPQGSLCLTGPGAPHLEDPFRTYFGALRLSERLAHLEIPVFP